MADDLPLETILSNLKRIANDVRTDHQAVEKQLKKCGYDVPENDRNPYGVMKVLAVAVHETVQQKVDLKEVDPDTENYDTKLLEKVLGVESLYNCFLVRVKQEQLFQTAKSPRDMAKYLKKNRKGQKAVKKIIENQFQIKWNTTAGEQDINHTFYQFCDTERTEWFFKYGPRQAHAKATLYKERRTQSTIDLQSISERKENLCPKVYIKTANGWKTWDANNDSDLQDTNLDQLEWIHPSIKSFIEENADEQGDDSESLQQSLDKTTLYWAVLDDSDFITGEKLKLEEIGKTQVYVGKADNGIRGRWTKEKYNHCKMMKKCLDNVLAMKTYDPSRLEGISLVDARLALAKVRVENTAVFVMKTFTYDAEKAKLHFQASLCEARKHLNGDLIGKQLTNETSSEEFREYLGAVSNLTKADIALGKSESCLNKHEAEAQLVEAEKNLKKGQECFDAARTCLEDLQAPKARELEKMVKKLQKELDDGTDDFRKALKETKSEIQDQLKIAEKKHQEGRRYPPSDLDIIPRGGGEKRWEPKDSRYGMNSGK